MKDRTLLTKWSKKVRERDNYECKMCKCKEKLHAHHIIPKDKDLSLRYNINNGITLCISCHAKTEGYQKGHKHSAETKKKLSVSHLGQKSWNKGLRMSDEHRKKLSEAHLGIPLSENHKKALCGKKAWNKGLKAPEHVRQILIEANRKNWEKRKLEGLAGPRKGMKASEEQKRKVSESLKMAYANGTRIRKPVSEETKKKISDTKKRNSKCLQQIA